MCFACVDAKCHQDMSTHVTMLSGVIDSARTRRIHHNVFFLDASLAHVLINVSVRANHNSCGWVLRQQTTTYGQTTI